MWLIRELMTAWRSVFTVAQWKKAGQCGWYQPWERRVLLSVSLIFWLWATGYYQDQNSSPSLNLVLSLMPWKSNNQWLHDIFHQTLLPPGNYSSSKIVKNRGGKKKKKMAQIFFHRKLKSPECPPNHFPLCPFSLTAALGHLFHSGFCLCQGDSQFAYQQTSSLLPDTKRNVQRLLRVF